MTISNKKLDELINIKHNVAESSQTIKSTLANVIQCMKMKRSADIVNWQIAEQALKQIAIDMDNFKELIKDK